MYMGINTCRRRTIGSAGKGINIELQCNVSFLLSISYYPFFLLIERHFLNLDLAMQRKYDIVLLGATGFTGGLMVEYMTATFPGSLRWAIAARNKAKLEEVTRKFKVEAAGGELVRNSIAFV